MNKKIWLILFILIILVVILFSKIFTTKNKSVDFSNVNQENYMKIKSNIFTDNNFIPAEYTCDGGSLRIPFEISDVPRDAKSLAIIVDDPDAPNGDFVHWIIWNINPEVSILESKEIPSGAVEGYTSSSKPGWIAPCPPFGIHHYNFKLYALDVILSIGRTSNKLDLIRAMDGHVIEEDVFIGLYGRGE